MLVHVLELFDAILKPQKPTPWIIGGCSRTIGWGSVSFWRRIAHWKKPYDSNQLYKHWESLLWVRPHRHGVRSSHTSPRYGITYRAVIFNRRVDATVTAIFEVRCKEVQSFVCVQKKDVVPSVLKPFPNSKWLWSSPLKVKFLIGVRRVLRGSFASMNTKIPDQLLNSEEVIPICSWD